MSTIDEIKKINELIADLNLRLMAIRRTGGGANHVLLSATHPDTTPAAVVRGDIITGQGVTPKWTRLALGMANKYPRSNGTDVLWSLIQAGDLPAHNHVKADVTDFVHASSHKSGGGDAIKLDDFAAPDDNTDLDFSTTKHGLVPKGTNVGDFLKDDGSWAAAGGADKIEEGDSSVEVIDAGTGYIETKADGSQVRKDQILGNIQPLQPAFNAYPSSNQLNIAPGGYRTIIFDLERFDQGGNFNLVTYKFTAPVDGRLFFSFTIHFTSMDNAADWYQLRCVTSNKSYVFYKFDPDIFTSDLPTYTLNGGGVVDMDANDTAYMNFYQFGGNQQTDITVDSFFTGALVC